MASNEARMSLNYNDKGVIDVTTGGEELSKITKKKQDERAKMMEGVATQKEAFTKEVGMQDLTGGQIMKNKIQGIADSYKQFSEMLRQTAADRKVDVTDKEAEHMYVDAVPTGMAVTHNYYRANRSGRLNGRK